MMYDFSDEAEEYVNIIFKNLMYYKYWNAVHLNFSLPFFFFVLKNIIFRVAIVKQTLLSHHKTSVESFL